jgi:prepilin-type N-terminal cleavage/methylation domain-containing protein
MKDKLRKGFTVLEMLVVLAISGIIATISISGLLSFYRQARLVDTAFEIASVIREVQSYAYFVKAKQALPDDDTFRVGYGVQFGSEDIGKSGFVSFEDHFLSGQNNGDYKCNESDTLSGCINFANNSTTEFIKKYTLSKGVYIKSFCAQSANTPMQNYCRNFSSDSSQINRLSIVFVRPNPASAHIKTNLEDTFSEAKIELTTNSGNTSTVVITNSGQIYVQ